jgi:hypothetical protein
LRLHRVLCDEFWFSVGTHGLSRHSHATAEVTRPIFRVLCFVAIKSVSFVVERNGSPADFHDCQPGTGRGEGRSDFYALDNCWPGFRVASESSPRRTPRARPAWTVLKMLVGLTNK